MRKYDFVLFDFDGTLYNTFLGIARSCQYAMKVEMGREYPDIEVFRKCIGPPLREIFVSGFGLSEEEARRTVQRFRERYNREGVLECELYPGVRELLNRLRAEKVGLAIASSKPASMIRTILGNDRLLDQFDFVTGIQSEDDPSTKTDMVRRALDYFGPDGRAVMIGDRFYDAEGAQNMGIDFIAALYGFGPESEFAPYPSVLHAHSAQEISEFLLLQE